MKYRLQRFLLKLLQAQSGFKACIFIKGRKKKYTTNRRHSQHFPHPAQTRFPSSRTQPYFRLPIRILIFFFPQPYFRFPAHAWILLSSLSAG